MATVDPIAERKRLAQHWLSLLPEPDDTDMLWDDLSEWEQQFLTSVRQQFAQREDVSEKQFAVLERIYKKSEQ